jgi:hypothetical protein
MTIRGQAELLWHRVVYLGRTFNPPSTVRARQGPLSFCEIRNPEEFHTLARNSHCKTPVAMAKSRNLFWL